MEQPSMGSRRYDENEFNLKEWGIKAKISRENTRSRRYSASYIRSLGEDCHSRSLRSNITISSTASSPGYAIREEINPSTYSFTTALKALQAKTIYGWEYMSPDGLALNSKWSEAERYICNPLSGEVPLECLSAKTLLNGRSFRQITSSITMSAPLVYPAPQPRNFQVKIPITSTLEDEVKTTIQEKKINSGMMTKDVGIQSKTVDDNNSNSPHTPSIEERSIKRGEAESVDSSSISSAKGKFEEVVEMKKTREDEKEKDDDDAKLNEKKKSSKQMSSGSSSSGRHGGGGCLPWWSFWTEKRKHQKNIHKPMIIKNIFLCHVKNGC